jgi:predicted acylesterase/phospholipase RssA
MPSKDSSNHNNKPDKQRALVLQGGGALGVYEVVAIKGLYEKLTQQDEENALKDNRRFLFDIVAGTSIGTMNAAVLVSNVIKKKSWKDAIDELEKFWTQSLASSDVPPLEMLTMFPWWRPWKEKWHKKIDGIAIEEAARRYYSTKYFVFGGKKVFSTKEIRPDYKFFDQDNNAKWLVLNDEPLQRQIETFGAFPIKSSFDKGEPRFLVTAVDIAEGITVTFDSYKKADGKRKTVYYSRGKYGHKRDSKQIVIEYENGISIEHVMASGTIPELYEPKEICNDPNDEICKFWDGGLLSNTPLKELLEAHRDYWVNVENKDSRFGSVYSKRTSFYNRP